MNIQLSKIQFEKNANRTMLDTSQNQIMVVSDWSIKQTLHSTEPNSSCVTHKIPGKKPAKADLLSIHGHTYFNISTKYISTSF